MFQQILCNFLALIIYDFVYIALQYIYPSNELKLLDKQLTSLWCAALDDREDAAKAIIYITRIQEIQLNSTATEAQYATNEPLNSVFKYIQDHQQDIPHYIK